LAVITGADDGAGIWVVEEASVRFVVVSYKDARDGLDLHGGLWVQVVKFYVRESEEGNEFLEIWFALEGFKEGGS